MYIYIHSCVYIYGELLHHLALRQDKKHKHEYVCMKHLDIFKGAPLRLQKSLSDQFPVRVCSCPLCIQTVCVR